MFLSIHKYLSEGTRVRVATNMDVPESSAWDDDGGRTSTRAKKMLQKRFFRGDPHLTAEVVHVATETERQRLRRKGLVKLRIRDQTGSYIALTADPQKLIRSN